jgi:hypothetical protein
MKIHKIIFKYLRFFTILVNFFDSSSETEILAESFSELLSNFYVPNGSSLRFIISVKNENLNQLKDFLEAVLTSNKEIPFLITDINSLTPSKDIRRLNFFIIDSIESFNVIYEKFKELNFRIRRISTFLSLKILSEDEIQKIFECFPERIMTNINLFNSNNSSVDLFTFIPFSNENSCGGTKPVKINSFIKKWQHKNFVVEKSKNMFGCPLKVGVALRGTSPGISDQILPNGTLELSGIEKEIFDEISKRLNFKIDFKIFDSSIGVVLENGTATNIFGAAKNHEIDVAIGSLSLQLTRATFLSQTVPHGMHPLVLVGEKNLIFIS